MSQYLVLSKIDVQNANAIAGFTWGFPAVSHFLGFTHALNRKFSSSYQGNYDAQFVGCAVIAHQHHSKTYRPNYDIEFLQSKNPPVLAKHKKASPPIIEEGKMNMTVSLIIQLDQVLSLNTEQTLDFELEIQIMCEQMRLAGGSILRIGKTKFFSDSDPLSQKRIKRLVMPGFALKDRCDYLQQYSEKEKLNTFDAWLDFAALKYKATEPQTGESKKDIWNKCDKPSSGWLVPLMTGYKAISPVYSAGEVVSTRDVHTPSCYTEAVHSVGEWLSVHRVQDIADFIWRYQFKEPWYLCTQVQQKTVTPINQNRPTISFGDE